jgi:DNA modification methylase
MINDVLLSTQSDFIKIPYFENIVDTFPLDRDSIPQKKLNLIDRSKTNLFTWRGQFSPDLIKLFLDNYSKLGDVVLDPFVGCGTTLFESANKSLSCIGVDVNPAAIEISRTVLFSKIEKKERMAYLTEAKKIIDKYLPEKYDWSNYVIGDSFENNVNYSEIYRMMIENSLINPYIYNIIINTIMRYFISNNGKKSFYQSFNTHKDIILDKIPYNRDKVYDVFQTDARNIPIKNESINLIITSPPYINVFNYHENYREIMELIGWDILKVAKSEIGSNRQNRGNRYLTVIQYSADMMQSLMEMKRVIKKDGRIIIIVGRESKVKGTSFPNYKIISILAQICAGLTLIKRQERQFTGRFGEKIIEDILHFKPNENELNFSLDVPRTVGKYFLEKALSYANEDEKTLILSAIKKSEKVNPSSLFLTQV